MEPTVRQIAQLDLSVFLSEYDVQQLLRRMSAEEKQKALDSLGYDVEAGQLYD